jgi:hypothetical protein
LAAHDFKTPSDARIAGGITGGTGVALAAIGIPLTFSTESRIDRDKDHQIVKVFNERGYAVPFLPDIKLSKSMTLTQRGIAF